VNARAGTYSLKYVVTPKTVSWHVSDNPYDLLACTSNRSGFFICFLWHGSPSHFSSSLSFLLSETISLTDRECYLARSDEKFLHGQKIILSVKPGVVKQGICTHPVLHQRQLLSQLHWLSSVTGILICTGAFSHLSMSKRQQDVALTGTGHLVSSHSSACIP